MPRFGIDSKSGNKPGTESDLAPDLGHHDWGTIGDLHSNKYAICYQVWHQVGTTSRTELARTGTKSGATSCTKSGNGSGARSGTRSDAKSAARKAARPGAMFGAYTVPDGTWCSRSL